ncbi:hypothetical protein RHMOL_Rhmol05G0172500 [Rhododendron molle]|uniref:Uncharacterized protein n=1 Tax=Rhododendron molle TaxID=49168 RepID=A0ACC0NQ75_RHOML|nr:hypothetical protein RHMOL_Rhmol05G0172500 [Rhododendron molle]
MYQRKMVPNHVVLSFYNRFRSWNLCYHDHNPTCSFELHLSDKESLKEKRFHNWLENARDWAVSRSRFWGTPLPVWTSDDGEETIVMDSIDKLEKLSSVKVFDCWFESGSTPYAYIHYPFENVELFEKNIPGHFVAEGLDQTRGWETVVVHAEFLDDIAGKLTETSLNIYTWATQCLLFFHVMFKQFVTPLQFNFLSVVCVGGTQCKRLGKSMGIVAKEVKAMSQKDILDFEKHGEVTIATHCLKLSDIKIKWSFWRPDNMTEEEIDAAGDGDVLVILDLRPDESLFEAGVAREVVNRIQKLRKKAALEPTDMVEVYFKLLDEDEPHNRF